MKKQLLKEFYPNTNNIDVNISNKDVLKVLLAVIYGDILGSQFEFLGEFHYKKSDLFPFDFIKDNENDLFTDDTVLTIATLDAILNNKEYSYVYKKWGQKYPNHGFGSMFKEWVYTTDAKPYNSMGNGSAMRVYPVLLKKNLEDIIYESYKSSIVTHNHPEGIKGAIVAAVCLYLSFTQDRKIVKDYLYKQYKSNKYNPIYLPIKYMHNNTELAPMTVPYAIKTAIVTKSVEDCCISIINKGGDTDTALAIALPISINLNGIPEWINKEKLFTVLPFDIRTLLSKVK